MLTVAEDTDGGTPRSAQDSAKALKGSPRLLNQVPNLNTTLNSLYDGDYGQQLPISGGSVQTNCCWPAEIVDSMAWSAQFFDFGSERLSHGD